ncbi:hypothetical protein NYE67_20395, partial [Solibacillus sp. FSL W8-0474]
MAREVVLTQLKSNGGNYFTYSSAYDYVVVETTGIQGGWVEGLADDYSVVFSRINITPGENRFLPIGSQYNGRSLQVYTNTNNTLRLERQLKNTAPGAPGAFTSPAAGTILRGGQNVSVVWGASTDAEGNLSGYDLETAYNGGTFGNVVGTLATSNPNAVIGTSSNAGYTTIQFRVRARDTNGAYSGYQTSPVYTIDHNRPPNAPIAKSPLGTMEKPFIVQGNKRPTLNWNFSDPDVGNWQTSYVVKVVNGYNGDDVKYYQDLAGGEQQHTPISDLPNNTLLAWAAVTRDQNGVAGPWSGYQFFVVNMPPMVNLTTLNNQNLTENAKFNVSGDVVDIDVGNAFTLKYSINGGTTRNIMAQISNNTTPIPFTKELLIRNGRLYDGSTEVTGNLAEGVGHVLSVWAEDDKGGKSTVQ